MGQLPLGTMVLVGLIAAFWLTSRMPPKVAVSPEEWLQSRKPGSTWTEPIWIVAASVVTATIFGGAIALHRWPEAVLYLINLSAIVILLVFQLSAIERGSKGAFPKSGAQARLNGALCTVYGVDLLYRKPPTEWFELGILFFLAVSLVVRLMQEAPKALSGVAPSRI